MKETKRLETERLNKERNDRIAEIKRNEEDANSVHNKTAALEREVLQMRLNYHVWLFLQAF